MSSRSSQEPEPNLAEGVMNLAIHKGVIAILERQSFFR